MLFLCYKHVYTVLVWLVLYILVYIAISNHTRLICSVIMSIKRSPGLGSISINFILMLFTFFGMQCTEKPFCLVAHTHVYSVSSYNVVFTRAQGVSFRQSVVFCSTAGLKRR